MKITMSSNIVSHVDLLAARLEKFPRVKRVAFALWCAQPLLNEFSNYLGNRIGSDNMALLLNAINELWNWVITGTAPQASIIQQARNSVKSIDWPEADVEPDEETLDFGATQLLGSLKRLFDVFETGSSKKAAEPAVGLINRIDFELGMIEGVDDPLADSRLLGEINRQKQMLKHLETEPKLSNADRTRFRT
ncbi:MAG: hypothetical protein J2P21_30110 [Chloracidobacterium sp.]|nr:hypothetical protein [Chloracidobacterium sp.]